jgi:8-oxo-dGTP pyrophosphatase MutT (NUDIX family)
VLIFQRTLRQAAALPYVWTPKGVEVALITSKDRKRWIIPKGWPEKNLSLGSVAAIEAMEEAGIHGIIAPEPAGSFVYEKRLDQGYAVPCNVLVFPLLACEQRLTWKEKKRRRLMWLPLDEVAKTADDRGLAKLLGQLATKLDRLPPLAEDAGKAGEENRITTR